MTLFRYTPKEALDLLSEGIQVRVLGGAFYEADCLRSCDCCGSPAADDGHLDHDSGLCPPCHREAEAEDRAERDKWADYRGGLL